MLVLLMLMLILMLMLTAGSIGEKYSRSSKNNYFSVFFRELHFMYTTVNPHLKKNCHV